MSKYIILYRIKDDYHGCRYINIDNDVIHLDYQGKPIVSNASCSMRINEEFDEVETWLSEDVFNRMKNTDGTDTFNDVLDMIANGEHKEFETYVRETEIETMCEEYALDVEDVEEILYNYNNNDYFDMSIIANVWHSAYDIAKTYVDECCNIESWLTSYIDFDGLGEAMVNDGWYYTLYDDRVVEYNY